MIKRKVVLLDLPEDRIALKPFAFTKPLAEIRIGIATITEKWQHYFPGDYSYMSCSSLHTKYTNVASPEAWYVNATICPDIVLAEAVGRLKPKEVLSSEDESLIAFRLPRENLKEGIVNALSQKDISKVPFCGEITQIKQKWDIFLLNIKEIEKDWQWHRKSYLSKSILDPHTVVYDAENIFIEEGLAIKAALLNATEGPIYIGKNVTIEEGAILRGPVAICDYAHIHSNALIYGGSTIGPYTRVGGVVYNSLIWDYTDKNYQGFIGNSVIGHWCTIGMDTNLSNTQQDNGNMAIWDFAKETLCQELNVHHCGVFMGDYSQIDVGVNIEGGSIIGVASHLSAIPLIKHIPSFISNKWGNLTTINLEQFIEQLANKMQAKQVQLLQQDKEILCDLFDRTAIHRMKARI